MIPDLEDPVRRHQSVSRVLVVDDEQGIREPLADLLRDEGYDIVLAENGQEALRTLRAERSPDIIVLDLRMPVMDGWEFRAIQKEDPTWGLIPVVAISADASAQAVAISADAYLRKPLDPIEVLRTIERILFERERRKMTARLQEAERLASLGRVAAAVGHEINNPLAFAVLNLGEAVSDLRTMSGLEAAARPPLQPGASPDGARSPGLAGVLAILEDCQDGLDRIRCAVGNLQRISRHDDQDRAPLDIVKLVEQSISMAWNQIRHRARLVRHLGALPPVHGNAQALGQVFLNLLVNAAQAIPEGSTEQNEIAVATLVQGDQLVVEIRDTGSGIPPEIVSRIFDPFFTTKPVGFGTGLGLFISRQTLTEHGGHMTIESAPGQGTVFRVFLPCGASDVGATTESRSAATVEPPSRRSRVLVIDDEPAIGRAIHAGLRGEHDVVVAHNATEAFARLTAGETFDLVLCDLMMPNIGGPEVYASFAERWPELTGRTIFMTGGAFTDATSAFIAQALTPVVFKPFRLDELKALVGKHLVAKN